MLCSFCICSWDNLVHHSPHARGDELLINADHCLSGVVHYLLLHSEDLSSWSQMILKKLTSRTTVFMIFITDEYNWINQTISKAKHFSISENVCVQNDILSDMQCWAVCWLILRIKTASLLVSEMSAARTWYLKSDLWIGNNSWSGYFSSLNKLM